MAQLIFPKNLSKFLLKAYGPLIGYIILWGSVFYFFNSEALFLLMTAYFYTAAAYGLSTAPSKILILQRKRSSLSVWKKTLRIVWNVECITALFGIAIASLLYVLLKTQGHAELSLCFLGILAGLPARYSGPLKARSRLRKYYQLMRSWGGVILSLIALWIFGTVFSVVIALALREWLATAFLYLSLPQVHYDSRSTKNTLKPPRLYDFANVTPDRSNRRMYYLISKYGSVLLIGPIGVILSKAGRILIDPQRLRTPLAISWAIGIFCCAGGLFSIVYFSDIKALFFGAFFLRIGTAALSSAIWQTIRQTVLAL